MNRLTAISILSIILFLAGCGRHVTKIETFGTQMTVDVTFRGNIDVLKNHYFMVISTNESFSFPILPPEGASLDEFLEPGDPPVIGDMADYFNKYYSTWHSYIVLDNLGYFLVRGPFIQTSPITREPIAILTNITNNIHFTIRLARIFPVSVPDTIYFDVISVDYPTNAQKYLKDHIAPPNRSILKTSGSVLYQSDETKNDIDPSLDIISWSVKIE